ncbi:MAG: Gfo/Idh/MocA family protein [Planctomycetota bacterium]|jgi:predicted dehydrogenase
MQRLKTAIVGCGKVTDLHAAALANLEESDFRAVCSRSQEKAERYGQKYGVRGYCNLDEMITKEKLDVIIVCTPHPYHAAPAIEAAELGVHILVEKPLASCLGDCDAMIEAARKGGVKLGTVCQRRFYGPCQRIRKAIDDGKIGKPVLGTVYMLGWRDRAYYESDPWRGTWDAEGGGAPVNQAPHQLDLLQWYMGPIDELFAFWDNLNHPYIEVEDTAVAVIRFKNGGLGNIMVSNSQNPALFGKVMIHGDNSASVGVQTDGGAMFIAGMSDITEPPINDYWTVPGEEKMLEEWQQQDAEFFNSINAMEYYHELQIRDFLRAVIDDRDPLVTGEAGRRTVEIFTAVYRSQRDRAPVRFPLKPDPDKDRTR